MIISSSTTRSDDLSETSRPTVRDRALEVWESLNSENWAHLLAELAPYTSDDMIRRLLIAVRAIQNRDLRTKLLASLVLNLEGRRGEVLCSLWSETLAFLATRTRKDLLSDIPALEPALRKLGGDQAVARIVKTIEDVGPFWP